eukprot:14795044-Heterocapsa_arctica.AAC.1
MREYSLRHVSQSGCFGDADAHEFNNVYARFYMTARTVLTQDSSWDMSQQCDQEFTKAFRKMQSELAEKSMPPLPWDANSFAEFASHCAAFPS